MALRVSSKRKLKVVSTKPSKVSPSAKASVKYFTPGDHCTIRIVGQKNGNTDDLMLRKNLEIVKGSILPEEPSKADEK